MQQIGPKERVLHILPYFDQLTQYRSSPESERDVLHNCFSVMDSAFGKLTPDVCEIYQMSFSDVVVKAKCVMDCEPVQLEPFVHQVGGSSSVLCFDAHTICKPLIPREHDFYQTMPQNMKEFTPEHRGVVEVKFQEDSEGYVNLVAYPTSKSVHQKSGQLTARSPSSGGDTTQSDSDSESLSSDQSQSKHRFRLKRSGSIEIETVAEAVFERVNPLNEDEDSATFGHNPWSLRCHMLQLAKMKEANTDSDPPKFILLENLASHFKLPCILDLKMGTQQHGDDSSEEKRRIHIAKCQKSTSSSLGVRVCGMQVYQASTSRFVCHDKYYGRQLTVQGFYQTLYQFMHNGVHLRTDMIDNIIHRIETLRQILRKQETFRFYSSSLLIMYDGSEESMRSKPAQCNGDSPSVEELCPTLSSSIVYSNEKYKLAAGAHGEHKGTPTADGTWDTSSGVHLETNRHVDVRMIDFAHATHKGFDHDDQVHFGPDEGYLFGLESLLNAFCMIRDNAC